MTTLMLATILLTVTFSAVAQLALKLGVGNASVTEAMHGSAPEIVRAMLFSPLIWTGLIIYGVSVMVWLWVLTKVDLSVAYPFVGVSFVITMVFSYFLLGENVGFARLLGTLLIAVGCVLVARTA